MRSILTLPVALLVTLLFLSMSSPANAMELHFLPRQLVGTSGVLGGIFGEGASGTSTQGAAASTSSTSETTSTDTTTSPTTTPTTTPTTSNTPPTTTTPTTTTVPTTTSNPTTSTEDTTSLTSSSTTLATTTSQASTSQKQSVVTTVITRTSDTKTYAQTATSTDASAAAASSTGASLTSGNKSSSSSGLSSQSKKTIIGVVCGIGGAIILAALGILGYRIWGRRKDEDEDDLYDPNAHDTLRNDEKSHSASAENNPFKRTLDQYHNPGPVNTASNF